ncbi:MAG: porin family protein [Prolixibacteraceae bacterium]|nr:porin family protein [Prolixibacteraceae bacterium]
MPFKKLIFSLFFLTSVFVGKAQQQTADIGLFGGGSIPFTDYTKTKVFQSVKPTGGLFYRYNFNSRISFRINAFYGNVGAVGYIDNENVPLRFEKGVLDISTVVEINYLDFILGVNSMKFSPFVSYGVGMSFYPNFVGISQTSFNIPIGIGAKYALSKRWGIGAEITTRKLFKDNLDNFNDPYRVVNLPKVNDWLHNNDWINYMGFTITYKFYWGSRPCATYE